MNLILLEYTEINEINENTVHVIPSPMKYSQHPSQELNMANLDWKEVAKPYHDELIEDVCVNFLLIFCTDFKGLVDRNFAKIRWVSKSMRPYCTFAVSNDLDSYFFPMTFFVHTGSSRNYIKKSLFHLINPGKITVCAIYVSLNLLIFLSYNSARWRKDIVYSWKAF